MISVSAQTTTLNINITTLNYQDTTLNSQDTTKIKIIKFIKQNLNATIIEIAKVTGLSRDGAKYHITSLKEKGTISRDGSKRKGVWIVN
jgi:predicted HTH transcriptional regulator